MARTAIRRRLTWRLATVAANTAEARAVHRLSLQIDDWDGHLPGQHVDVRLTAPDGYQAQRSYSIASAPESPTVDLVVQRLDDGEVSPYLTDGLQAGDQLELRGPIGGYFVWSAAADRADAELGLRPVQLVAGGSGVAPFLAMVDHHRRQDSSTALRLLYSTRASTDVLGRDVLGAETTVTLTREVPADWRGETGRVDSDMLERCTFPVADRPRIFVCGSTPFVESVAATLIDIGHDPSWIRLERYGNSGEAS
jgi:ferredoxin-NADP reductase